MKLLAAIAQVWMVLVNAIFKSKRVDKFVFFGHDKNAQVEIKAPIIEEIARNKS